MLSTLLYISLAVVAALASSFEDCASQFIPGSDLEVYPHRTDIFQRSCVIADEGLKFAVSSDSVAPDTAEWVAFHLDVPHMEFSYDGLVDPIVKKGNKPGTDASTLHLSLVPAHMGTHHRRLVAVSADFNRLAWGKAYAAIARIGAQSGVYVVAGTVEDQVYLAACNPHTNVAVAFTFDIVTSAAHTKCLGDLAEATGGALFPPKVCDATSAVANVMSYQDSIAATDKSSAAANSLPISSVTCFSAQRARFFAQSTTNTTNTTTTTASPVGTSAPPGTTVATTSSPLVYGTASPGNACNCSGRAYYIYQSSYRPPSRPDGCYCYCYWPYGGQKCESCSDPTYRLVGGVCVDCLSSLSQNYLQLYYLSGGTAQLTLPAVTAECAAHIGSFTIMDTINASLTTSPITIDLPARSCSADSSSWERYQAIILRFTGAITRTKWLGSINCIPIYPASRLAGVTMPEKIHFHLLDSYEWQVATALTLYKATLDSNTGKTTGTVTASVGQELMRTNPHSARLHTAFTTSDPATLTGSKVQTFLNMVREGSTSYYAGNYLCGFHADASFMPTGTKAVVFIGNVYGCWGTRKTELYAKLAAIKRAGIDIFVISGNPPTELPYLYTQLSWDWNLENYYSYIEFLSAIVPVSCGSALSPLPKRIGAVTRPPIALRGICEVPKKCCFTYGDKEQCSTTAFEDLYKGVSCYPPFALAGERTLKVVKADDTIETAAITVRDTPANVRAYWWCWNNKCYYYLYRLFNYWSSQRLESRCCSIVGVGTDPNNGDALKILGPLTQEKCFTYYAYGEISTHRQYNFGQQPLFTAMRCYQKEPDVQLTPSQVAAELNTSMKVVPRDDSSGRTDTSNTADHSEPTKIRIQTYLDLMNTIDTTEDLGVALWAVAYVLRYANLISTVTPDERPCGPEEPGPKCYYTWTAKAKDAGPHLISAGFERIESDFYLQNAAPGDIVVFPGFTIGTTEYPNGYIAIKHHNAANASDRNWVGTIKHTKDIFPGLFAAFAAGQTPTLMNSQGVALYRLKAAAEMTPTGSNEELTPINAQHGYVTDAKAWMDSWISFDLDDQPTLRAKVTEINNCYRCPASFSATAFSAFPSQLWRRWFSGFSETCWVMNPSRATNGLGVRCCYTLVAGFWTYVQKFPSMILLATNRWTQSGQVAAEKIGCTNETKFTSSTEETCKLFMSRRPPPLSTNALFQAPSKWQPQRRRAGGRGDPHCTSFDGAEFECNFLGEAKFTQCGDWKVHVVAQHPDGVTFATVYTQVAVQHGTDTFTGILNASVGASTTADVGAGTEGSDGANRNFTILLNGQSIGDYEEATNLTVSVTNNTVRVEDVDGNLVIVSFQNTQLSMQVAPAEACFNRTAGLAGNNDGNKTNDWVTNSGSLLGENTTQDVIYSDFVLDQLVTSVDHSLFAANDFIAGNRSYLPNFSNASTLANCPAACSNDVGCCFDYSVGGDAFVSLYVAAKADFDAANAQAIAFGANFPPVFTEAPAEHVVPTAGSSNTTTITVTASDNDGNITALWCSMCNMTTYAACTTPTIGGTGAVTITITLRGDNLASTATLTDMQVYTCNATDNSGAVTSIAVNLVATATSTDPFAVGATPAPQAATTPDPATQNNTNGNGTATTMEPTTAPIASGAGTLFATSGCAILAVVFALLL